MANHRISSPVSLSPIFLLLLIVAGGAWAKPTTSQEAVLAVTGWLADDREPFDVPVGNYPMEVETVTAETGEPLYYVVRLHPAGSVIVPADDLVEPILSFSGGPPAEPNANDPLIALVTADVNRRLAEAYTAQASGQIQVQSATETQSRWDDLIRKAVLPPDALGILSLPAVSDVRVAPLLKTRWAQGNVCSRPCYNYFTPSNTPAGCTATAMAQLLYYYRYPAAGIGRHSFTIRFAGREQSAATRGGDGLGGPYRWDDMIPSPDCASTASQREAIGALCYDLGVTVRTSYAPEGSGADAFLVATALKTVFGFSNGISGANNGKNIGSGLAGMINPNLDAQFPVILGILGQSGHAVVADGYGYDLATRTKPLYHHLNMGWAGRSDVWYNLPDIGDYDTVPVCVYNLFPAGTGEIISGRVLDTAGQPIPDVAVRATLGVIRYEVVTNDKGIYALTGLPSANPVVLQAGKPGYAFAKLTVTTGTSQDRQAAAGNRWGLDIIGTRTTNSLADAQPSEAPPAPKSVPSMLLASVN
jgi:hypothetical protein